jgi:hypothetical protein
MKKIERIFQVVLLIAFTLLCVKTCTPKAFGGVDVIDVIEAIEIVESNQNPYAINTRENAIGSLQI